MPKNKTQGLIATDSGKHLLGGLVGAIEHHADEHKLGLIVVSSRNFEEAEQKLRYRGRMISTDLRTMNNALISIYKIAKNNDYKDIMQILESDQYEEGHDFPVSPTGEHQ